MTQEIAQSSIQSSAQSSTRSTTSSPTEQEPIFHIANQTDWMNAKEQASYQHPSLQSEGFIHCSTIGQITKVANLFFVGQSDLVILKIDPDRLTAELRYDPVGDEFFPHVYGPIAIDAITQVVDFPPRSDGHFDLPAF